MTELEKMQWAKTYIDKLANGIDPITDIEMSEDSTRNNVRLSRCFFYVSDILRQVIENGGHVKRLYSEEAQRFIMDNLDAILEASVSSPEEYETGVLFPVEKK